MKIIFKNSYLTKFVRDYYLFKVFLLKDENKGLVASIDYLEGQMRNILVLDFCDDFSEDYVEYVMRADVTWSFITFTEKELPTFFKQYALFSILEKDRGLVYAFEFFKKYFNLIF